MALLAHPAFRHPALARIRNTLQSRVVLGVGYGVAAGFYSFQGVCVTLLQLRYMLNFLHQIL